MARTLLLTLFGLAHIFAAEATDVLAGKWTLTSWNSRPISEQHIAKLELTFSADGKMASRVVMDEKWNGMILEGSGTWSLAPDGLLTWTHGAGSGKTTVKRDNNILLLSEDILVRSDGGKVPGPATYKRSD